MKKLLLILLFISINQLSGYCANGDCRTQYDARYNDECTSGTARFDCATLLNYKTTCVNGRCEYIPFPQKNLYYIFN